MTGVKNHSNKLVDDSGRAGNIISPRYQKCLKRLKLKLIQEHFDQLIGDRKYKIKGNQDNNEYQLECYNHLTRIVFRSKVLVFFL